MNQLYIDIRKFLQIFSLCVQVFSILGLICADQLAVRSETDVSLSHSMYLTSAIISLAVLMDVISSLTFLCNL